MSVNYNDYSSFRLMTWDKLERFSIECLKTETKIITLANQKRGKYLEEPMRTQSKTEKTV